MYEIRKTAVSSGFSTVEHWCIFKVGDKFPVASYWTEEEAKRAFAQIGDNDPGDSGRVFVSNAEERRYLASKKKYPKVHRTSS